MIAQQRVCAAPIMPGRSGQREKGKKKKGRGRETCEPWPPAGVSPPPHFLDAQRGRPHTFPSRLNPARSTEQALCLHIERKDALYIEYVHRVRTMQRAGFPSYISVPGGWLPAVMPSLLPSAVVWPVACGAEAGGDTCIRRNPSGHFCPPLASAASAVRFDGSESPPCSSTIYVPRAAAQTGLQMRNKQTRPAERRWGATAAAAAAATQRNAAHSARASPSPAKCGPAPTPTPTPIRPVHMHACGGHMQTAYTHTYITAV